MILQQCSRLDCGLTYIFFARDPAERDTKQEGETGVREEGSPLIYASSFTFPPISTLHDREKKWSSAGLFTDTDRLSHGRMPIQKKMQFTI